jgi:PPK2 family polyphosphate:nucleotide phosphotransferase
MLGGKRRSGNRPALVSFWGFRFNNLVNAKELIKEAHRLAVRYRVSDGSRFKLGDFDPSDTAGLNDKGEARAALKHGVEILSEMQEKLYAQDRWSLLLVFQAMDAAGKDSAIKHVMSGVNPQGCQVFSFKSPTALELDHDYLWRTTLCLPERGRIGIFNRSYYEEVLAVRVHSEWLEKQKLPRELVTKKIWAERFEDIRNFERYLSRNGTVIRKFFLNVSKEEQKERFMKRLNQPEKNWKFSLADVAVRERWSDYMAAYEETIRNTATEQSPWYVIPADNKWFTRLIVAAAAIDALASLKLEFPKLDKSRLEDLEKARKKLSQE